MIAYSPFGSPDLPWGEKLPHILTDPVLKRIAEKHERSTANVALRWLLQRGLATIPKVCVMLKGLNQLYHPPVLKFLHFSPASL